METRWVILVISRQSIQQKKRGEQKPSSGVYGNRVGCELLRHLEKHLVASSHSQKCFTRLIICGFCIVQKLERKRCSAVEDWSSVMDADSS